MDRTIFGWFVVVSASIPLVLPNPYTFSDKTELKCHPYLTMNVTGELSNGLLHAYGYEFPEGYYRRLNRTHFSVCICKVTQCLRKCCLPGQVFLNRTCVNWYNYPIAPTVHDRNLQPILNYDYTKFFKVYGNTCNNGWFVMDPSFGKEDTHYFLQNGDLFVPYNGIKSTLYTDEFCFENIIRSHDQQVGSPSLQTVACFPTEESVTNFLRIGMIISIPFLLATFLVYAMPELRNLHGKNLMSHIGSLFVAYTSLIVVQMASNKLSTDVCIGIGYTIQYSFLASFFWLNVMCFDIWWAFSGFSSFKGDRRSTEKKKYLLYSLYAWGCSAAITIVTIILQFASGIPDSVLKPDIGDLSCFFSSQATNLAYFYGPIAFILLLDMIFFIMTAVKIITVKKETVAVFRGKDSNRNREASKQRYFLYLKLFLIMGVNWIMEVISWAAKGPDWAWYFTDFTNAFQGVLIFTIFVLKAKIKNAISSRFSSQTLKSFMKWESPKQSSRARENSGVANNLTGVLIFITFVCKRRVWRLIVGKICPHLKKKDSETNTSFTRISMSRNSSDVSSYNNTVVLPMKTVPNRKIDSS